MAEDDLKETVLKLKGILQKITQPPLQLATVIGIRPDTVDIALTGGNTYVVQYDPRLQNKFALGQTVRVSPESLAVVGIEGDIKSRATASVEDVLTDGRAVIEAKGEKKVVQTAVPLKVGDNVFVDNSYSVVVENRGNNSQAYKIDKVPVVPWSSIGGLENTIAQIKDTIELPFTHKELYSKFPGKKPAKGILLYGPPGCGKTLIGKAIAYNLALRKKERDGGELNGYFLYAAGPEFLRKYVGTGEEKIRELFANARETSAKNKDPVIIFIDEPEAVFKQRGTGISTDATDPLVNQMLVEMDGLNSLENILVLFATNRQELLDSALVRPGRIDRKIYVPRPSQEGAQQIFELYLKDLPLSKNMLQRKEAMIKEYAAHAAQEVYGKPLPILRIVYNDRSADTLDYKNIFSGASVVSIVGRATDYSIKRAIESGGECSVTKEDISQAVQQEYLENRSITNQVTPDDIKSVAKDKFTNIATVVAA